MVSPAPPQCGEEIGLCLALMTEVDALKVEHDRVPAPKGGIGLGETPKSLAADYLRQLEPI